MEAKEPALEKRSREWSGDHATYVCLDGVVVRCCARVAVKGIYVDCDDCWGGKREDRQRAVNGI